MLQILLTILQNIFQPKIVVPIPTKPREPESKPVPPTPIEIESAKKIDWSNPASKISKYFTVKEATFLPSWGILHIPTDDEKAKILKVAEKMDAIREFLNEPIQVHVWIRPEKANCPNSEWDGKDYNRYIYENQVWKNLTSAQKAEKKVPNSPHKTGDAVDWSIIGKRTPEYCATIRSKLLSKLQELDIRMEDIEGNWIHVDTRPVISRRFFKP